MADIGGSEAATRPAHGVSAHGGPVFSRQSETAIEATDGTTIATLGDPATLGMWTFASVAVTAGLFQAGVKCP